MSEAGLDVSVVVPCHAAGATVIPLLEALRAQDLERDRYEVIVVDPGADGTRRLLEDIEAGWTSPPRLSVVKGPLREGPAAKRNLGASLARGRVLAFTDADCIPEPDWLSRGLAAVDRGAQLVQGAVKPPDDARRHPLSHAIHVMSDVGLHETSNMFYERALFERLGGFTARYFRRYGAPFGEDADLGWRARRHGATYAFELGAVVRHPVGPPNLRRRLREQWLARAFPELVRDVPELRDALMFRRWFLTPRSAATLCAVAGLGMARRTPLATALLLPYARALLRELRHTEGGAAALPGVLAANVIADLTLLVALACGSVRARCLVI